MAARCASSLLTVSFVLFAALVGTSAAAAQSTGVVVTTPHQAAVAPLNSRLFAGNVLKGDWADHWVVLFCVDWYAPCQLIERHYALRAAEHQARYNTGTTMRDVVRFARVDCATDKPLCNEQNVEDYPTVVHYFRGERVGAWTSSRPKELTFQLATWLIGELSDADDEPTWQPEAPELSRDDVRFFMRLVAMAAAGVALFMWAAGRGTDIWLALQTQRKQSLKRKTTDRSLEVVATGRMARRLPRDWARRGASLEL